MSLIRSFLVLCSVVAVMAESSMVSGAVFVGVDTTKHGASPVDIFAKPVNHAAALSSIIADSAKSSDFIPSKVPARALGANYNEFMLKLVAFPGFNLMASEESALLLNGSLNQFEEAVRATVSDHSTLVGRGLRNLVPKDNPDEEMTSWLLSFLLMEKPDGADEVGFELFYVSMTIATDKDHTIFIPKQDATIKHLTFIVNGSTLVAYSGYLGQRIDITNVDHLIKLLTSPKADMTVSFGDSSSRARQQEQAVLAWTK